MRLYRQVGHRGRGVTQGAVRGPLLYPICLQYLDFDNLPDTNFSCVGKVIGGYYADLETNCQMFHVCTIGQLDEPMDIRFLCLNGTVFDQVVPRGVSSSTDRLNFRRPESARGSTRSTAPNPSSSTASIWSCTATPSRLCRKVSPGAVAA
jgi:hypothetical protein